MLSSLIAFAATTLSVTLSSSRYPNITITKLNRTFSSYWVCSLLGPLILFIFNPRSTISLTLSLFDRSLNVNPLSILLLFFSLTFLSLSLGKTGFFEHIATLCLKTFGNSLTKFYWTLFTIVSMTTIFTSNDVVILVLTPIIYNLTKQAGFDPECFLMCQFFSTNIWSSFLIIGNPTTLYLGAYFNLNFLKYTSTLFLTVIVAGFLNGFLIYKKASLKLISSNNDSPSEEVFFDRTGAFIGGLHLFVAVVLIAVGPIFHLNVTLSSLCVCCCLIVSFFIRQICSSSFYAFNYLKKVIVNIPWTLAIFLLSMFILTLSMERSGVSRVVETTLSDVKTLAPSRLHNLIDVYVYGITAAFSCNLLNNIPMSVLFASIINSQKVVSTASIYSVAFASNIGANITPLGSLAGIMWLGLLKSLGFELKFSRFIKYGFGVTTIVLFIGLSILGIQSLIL
ncbi:hypothetical protein P9112_008056 [Eukaryota sp. TZLM1-RC]